MSSAPGPGARVADYARYSTANQDERSIEGQHLLLDELYETKRWVRTGRYWDEAKSGSSTYGRTGLFELLAAAERGEFDVLALEDLDRFSRKAADLHTLIDTMEELDIVVVTLPRGEVVTDMEVAFKAVKNQQYLKDTSDKVRRGQKKAVNDGKILGPVVFGWRKVTRLDEKGEPIRGLREKDPVNAPILEQMLRDYDAGISAYAIVEDLNARGIKTQRGGNWRASTLTGNPQGGGLFRNHAIIGEFRYRKTLRKKRSGKSKTRYRPRDEWIVKQHPELAILDDNELFQRIQARLGSHSSRPIHQQKHPEYVLSRKVRCGWCGETYNVTSGSFACSGHFEMGVCTNTRRVKREVLERAVLAQIAAHLADAVVLEPCLAEYRAEAARAQSEFAGKSESARARLTAIEGQLDKLLTQLGDDQEDETPLAGRAIRRRIQQLGEEQERLQRQLDAPPASEASVPAGATVAERLFHRMSDLQALLSSEDREAVRAKEALRRLFDRVTLTPTPGTEVDGRGAGPLTVTVTGPLAEVLALGSVDVNRRTKARSDLKTGFGAATATYRFAFRLVPRDPRLHQVFADLPVVGRLLDDADAPVTKEAFKAALEEADGVAMTKAEGDARVWHVLGYLKRQGLIRRPAGHKRWSGWVWNHIDLSDTQWWERALARREEGYRLNVARAIAPEARVTIVERKVEGGEK